MLTKLLLVVYVLLHVVWHWLGRIVRRVLMLSHGDFLVSNSRRVAVIGGGIAGVSAAWSLSQSGKCEVTLFESEAELGGNAKTHNWSVDPKAAPGSNNGFVRTGLSVLAWPSAYFNHYELLLRRIGVPTTVVTPRFLISSDGGRSPSFAHGETGSDQKWVTDQERWDRAVEAARRVTAFCFWLEQMPRKLLSFIPCLGRRFVNQREQAGDSPRSIYEATWWNPLNVLPARFFVTRIWRVSDAFWDLVVVPVYSSSFLTAELDGLPTVILPTLDEIISVGSTNPLRPLATWGSGFSSKDVFDRMAADILRPGRNRITTKADLRAVEYNAARDEWVVSFGLGFEHTFDAVIFACPARAVDKLTNTFVNRKSFRTTLYDLIIPNILYENERDDNFTTGTIHSDVSVLPSPLQSRLLGGRFSNYISVSPAAPTAIENTFILGTWVPSAVKAASDGSSGSGFLPLDMYVTYRGGSNPKSLPNSTKTFGTVNNTWGHPQFTRQSLMYALLLRLLQGRCRAYYCASYTTPGNGHDLSMLSGVICAHAVTGYYPFPEATRLPRRDFEHLRAFMMGA